MPKRRDPYTARDLAHVALLLLTVAAGAAALCALDALATELDLALEAALPNRALLAAIGGVWGVGLLALLLRR